MIKMHSVVKKIAFKGLIGINSISMIFSDLPPSNIDKLENVGPRLINFRPLLFHSSVGTTVVNKFCDWYGAFVD